MQYLKALVIGLGILILLCIGLLTYGLLSKTSTKNQDTPETIGHSIQPFGEVVLEGHQGCEIAHAVAEFDRLVVTLEGTSPTCNKVFVIDMARGQILGSVRLGTQ